jgi:hypothetical protein
VSVHCLIGLVGLANVIVIVIFNAIQDATSPRLLPYCAPDEHLMLMTPYELVNNNGATDCNSTVHAWDMGS